MKFFGKSYSLYTKDIHQVWCRSAKFSWKSKFCSGSGSESGSWFYFEFQYQFYISHIEDTYQILFGSANSFESYCVHMKSPRTYSQTTRQTDRQPDRQTDGNFFVIVLSSKTYVQNMNIRQKARNFFFFTHVITILSLFTYSVCDKKVKRKLQTHPKKLKSIKGQAETHYYCS